MSYSYECSIVCDTCPGEKKAMIAGATHAKHGDSRASALDKADKQGWAFLQGEWSCPTCVQKAGGLMKFTSK